MRVLFDQGTPRPLRRSLAGHAVTLSRDLGWERLRNGGLLRAIAIVVPGNGNGAKEALVELKGDWRLRRDRIEVRMHGVEDIVEFGSNHNGSHS